MVFGAGHKEEGGGMTCIVGLVHGGKVYMGGDSAGVGEYDLTVRVDKKVFTNGPFLMGFTSSFRMGQLLAYRLVPPEMKEGQDIMEFMVNDFIDAVRDCLNRAGFATIKDNEESGGNFLVGFKGRLFNIAGDYQVGESASKFDACGCGEDLALGSLYSTKGKQPKARVELALEAAEAMSAGVRGPFTLMSL
jgi:ATP-dependent protease HslVU (ClpYQ) peptidase subunit